MTAETKKGIRDWPAKRTLLRVMRGSSSDKALIDEWASDCFKGSMEQYEVTAFADKFYATQQKWDESLPKDDKYVQVWQWFMNHYKASATVYRLWGCSFIQFVQALGTAVTPEDIQTVLEIDRFAREAGRALGIDYGARKQLESWFSPGRHQRTDADQNDPDIFWVRGHRSTSFRGPVWGLRNGEIDVSEFYNTPEAAHAWTALVDSNSYVMYSDCLRSLNSLVESADWSEALAEGRYNAAVSLGGGGSPEKDLILARALMAPLADADSAGWLHYVIYDMSWYMIQGSQRLLGPRLRREALDARVRIEPIVEDFLRLDEKFRRPDTWQNVVWAIFGGTIGNVSERDFFRSIKGSSRVKDLLIVGLDTHDGEEWSQFATRMEKQYRSKELDALLTSMHTTPCPEVAVSVRRRLADEPKYNVPESWIAEFRIREGGKDRILATSTRYVLEEFLNFARTVGGWEHLGTTPAPDGSTFRQLLLRRT